MEKVPLTVFKTKYDNILSNERSLAKTVSKVIIWPNPVTAWDIMIPIVFLFNFLKFKRARETFTVNFIFTKQLALDAALDMANKDESKEKVMSLVKDKTKDLLASDKKAIYSLKIRQKQLKEINLLIDHYYKLLNAEGQDYASMVKTVYKNKENYITFLGQLKQFEREVNKAARKILNTTEASKIILKMEETTDKLRKVNAEKIFTLTG